MVFSAAIIAHSFFPQDDPSIAIVQTFLVYAMGSAIKPLGAIVFGRWSDCLGRSFTLKMSMLGIAIPTTMIGFLPEYQHWGIASTALLVACRLMQGFFVAGEYDSVSVFILEHVGKDRACLANSFIGMAYSLGIMFASLAVMLIHYLPSSPYAWRIPFIIGGLLGGIVLWMRLYLIETPAFENYRKKQNMPPKNWFHIMRLEWRSIIAVICLCGSLGGCYHFYIIFWGTYLHKMLGLISAERMAFYTSIMMIAYILVKPLAGIFGDRFGMVSILKTGMLLVGVAILLNGYMLSLQRVSMTVICLTAMAISILGTAGYVYLFNLFKVDVRCQCLGLGHSIGSLLFSSSAPLLGTMIWKYTQNKYMPLVYLVLLLVLLMYALQFKKLKPAQTGSYAELVVS